MDASSAAPGRWRSRALAVVGASMMVVGVPGVLATLNAQTSNPTPQAVSSGTLKLTVSSTNPSAGFSTEVANLPAPFCWSASSHRRWTDFMGSAQPSPS